MAKKVTDSKITRHIDKNTTAFEHNSKTVLVNPPDGEGGGSKALTPRVGLVAPHPVQVGVGAARLQRRTTTTNYS